MSEQQFQVGDLVEAFGVQGKVMNLESSTNYSVLVDFVSGYSASFTLDGRERAWHKTPSLKLISRAQKTEKKKVWVSAYLEKPTSSLVGQYLHWVQIEAEVPVCDHEWDESVQLTTMPPKVKCKKCGEYEVR